MRTLLLAMIFAGCATEVPDELGSTESAVNVSDFMLPSLPTATRAHVVRAYDRLDPHDTIPRGLLEDAIVFFDVNRAHIPMASYFVVVDLSRYSGKDRFWLVDLASGAVEPHKVAHGDGSDPDNDGYATRFGNIDGSHESSLGFYLSGEIYDGTHPHSMRLDGLSPDGSPNGMADTNARTRAVVMHEATYVDDGNPSQQGRSNGCLALDPTIEAHMVDRIHDGSLLYVATKPLVAAVGRAVCGDGTCDGAETDASCPMDCATGSAGSDQPADGETAAPPADAGCSIGGGGGGGLLIIGGLLATRRRPRRARAS